MSNRTDVYTAITPFGVVEVDFPESGGVIFDGPLPAVEHLKAVIAENTGSDGIALSADSVEPNDFYHFCQPVGSKVTIMRPLDDLLSPELDETKSMDGKMIAMDDATGFAQAIAEMRASLRGASGIMAKLAVMADILGLARNKRDAEAAMAGDETAAPRNPSGQYYEFDPNRKPAQRKKDNEAAMVLLSRIKGGEISADSLTSREKLILAKYSGTGGALIGADGKKGSAYEYYTPKPVAEGIWSLLTSLGFQGGKVLDPCAGVGVFGATAPLSAAVDAVELNETSGTINGLVNDGPGYKTTVSPFEKVAAATPDEIYDAVVSNVPFGEVSDRGGNQLHDKRYQKEPIQNYFILRSLEKLKPGGLACFITPPRCVSGKGAKESDLRIRASYMAEFMGAYRLPNSVFGTAAADTMTDVIVFRKYKEDAAEKIAELREQNPEMLVNAKVQWQEFIQGLYFQGEGKKFVLGEFVPKDPEKFRDVDRVLSNASIGEIGQMLKRFPGSRVDWSALDAAETTPIIYRNGDTITQAGQTLSMKDGRWIPVEAGEQNMQLAELAGSMANPYAAFEARITYDQAVKFQAGMIESSQSLDIPGWLNGSLRQLDNLKTDAEKSDYWNSGIVGMSAAQVLEERMAEEVGVNYADEYTALSDAMQRMWSTAKSRPGVLTGQIKDGLAAITTHYNKKTGFSAVWRGDVNSTVNTVEVTADGSFEGLRYASKSIWVDMDSAKAIYGDSFDPFEDANWCVSADGKSVTKADDYFVGNYSDFIKKVDAELAGAVDDKVRGKILRQKLGADSRVDRIDVSQMSFNLFSPLVTHEEKAEFLRRFVHPSAAVVYDENTGEKRVDIDIKGSNLSDRDKLTNRIGDYLKNGTITLGGVNLGMDGGTALRELRRMVNAANEQFNSWTRSNRTITSRLDMIANQPEKLRFRQVADESPMPINGMSKELSLHGYQNAFVRKQGREFGGVNGDGVGLGKTFQGLAAVQYAQSIGVKKKTAFVVPNSVLSNWRKEAGRAYSNTDDCLFVGLRIDKSGKAQVNSSNYDADLTSVMENRHSKIFLTMEAFERIRLRNQTISDYEKFLRGVDSSFAESEDKKADEQAKSKQAGLMAILSEKSGSAPFIEDMGIDSIVVDEAHMFKNASSTVDFKSAKFLSLAPAAKRGIDAQAKFWYIRGQSPLKDGVLLLTATPITNSPLEIYSMLSLAVGHERVNDMCLGIKGADNFMDMMCVKENEDDVTMDGVARTTDVFVGLANVSVLRKAIGDISTIRTADDVGEQIIVPDRDEVPTGVRLPGEITDRLSLYKQAFRYAIDEIAEKSLNRGSFEAFIEVQNHFGEDLKLIGHPFNLINKMTLLISDPELDQRGTFYTFAPNKADKAMEVIKAFNDKKYTEDRSRTSPLTALSSIVSRKTKKDESGNASESFKIQVVATLNEAESKISIDTMDSETQSKFEAIAEKAGLDLDVTIPPKLAAMLENFQKEQASPRGIGADGTPSRIVKQIIFCDVLALHNKIKRILSKHAGVPASAIAVITGKTNNKPDEILAVQEGFNSDGESNKYRVVIANEKAEVGINLQIGTQAVHHLTIGWTPDSLEQRNGRGVRQGNKTSKVTIYHYDADGTFDSSKRTMVDKKADWIERVMDSHGGNTVSVSGGLSREQQEALIEVVGDANAMRVLQETIESKNKAVRAAANRERQNINIDTIIKQRAFIDGNEGAESFIINKIVGLRSLKFKAQLLRERIRNPKATASAVEKNKALLSELDASIYGLSKQIEDSAKILHQEYRAGGNQYVEITLDAMFSEFSSLNSRKTKDKDLADSLKGRSDSSFKVEAIEGGPIHSDWQSEVDMAQSMIDESVENFRRQSEESGGLPVEVAKAMADGSGCIWYGKALVAGTFVRLGNGLAVLRYDNKTPSAYGRDMTGAGISTTEKDLTAADWIYPGSVGYSDCITDAASIEDYVSGEGRIENGFSDIVPEVAARRKTERMTQYGVSGYSLPSPYFPYVITKTKAANSPIRQRIALEQSGLIKSIDDYTFKVPSSVSIEKIPANRSYYLAEPEAVLEYAKANGLKMSIGDLKGDVYLLSQIVGASGKFSEFVASLSGNSEEEIRANAAKFLRENISLIDYTNVDPSEDKALPYAYKGAIWSAIDKLVAGSAEAPQVTQVDAPAAVAPSENSGDEIVGISGDTYTHKDAIKAAANFAGKGKFKWDGKAVLWNVYRSTWDYLVKNNPSAASALKLVDATRSAI